MLTKAYPNVQWDEKRIKLYGFMKKASQRWLYSIIRDLLPTYIKSTNDVYEDYHHSELRFEESGIGIELDIYIPSLKLAFEYHGQQHYESFSLFAETEIYSRMSLFNDNTEF